ncbi:flagellar motor protein MotB [Hwanghaeella sp.]|uniref:flagellar motor protein MotB n=1 Tax=Hwanghaeella sp. TaxID=2605943 RepID=UPI003CCBA725
MADNNDNIIFKKIKIQEPGAHGGAWKIAYADFVTAMMAFFLLLWLLNATSEEVKEGLANYFQPTLRTTPSTSGSGGIFGGATANDPGPMEVTSTQAFLDSDSASQTNLDTGNEASGREQEVSSGDVGRVDAQAEEQTFTRIKEILESSIDELPPELEDLKRSLKVEIVEEGLSIQVIDHDAQSSFDEGSDKLTENARLALKLMSQFITRLPNLITIHGHTGEESQPLENWELSLQRANAARRALVAYGVPVQKFETVIGKGASDMANPEAPDAPENRRLAVIMLRMATDPVYGTSATTPPSIFENTPGPPALE